MDFHDVDNYSGKHGSVKKYFRFKKGKETKQISAIDEREARKKLAIDSSWVLILKNRNK